MGLRGGGINADRNIMTLPFSGAKYEHRNLSQKKSNPPFSGAKYEHRNRSQKIQKPLAKN